MVGLDELRDEHRQSRIGPLILAELERSVALATSRYDPRVYAHAGSWTAEARNDLVQEVAERRLLAEGQIEYIMSVTTTLEHFRHLLAFQVRRVLAKGRARTVVDNLLDRARRILEEPRFQREGRGNGTRYWLKQGPERRDATDGELRAAVRVASGIPRTYSTSLQRAPAVYDEERLRRVIDVLAQELPCWFTIGDLGRVFDFLLTDWKTSLLREEEVVERLEDVQLTPEEQAVVRGTAEELISRCDSSHLAVLHGKARGASDAMIAESLGVSRPTVIARKAELRAHLRAAGVRDLSPRLTAAVIARVTEHADTHMERKRE